MELSIEMSKMLDVIKEYDRKIRNNNDAFKRYLAPDITDKVLKRIVKNFDSHMGINSIVAVYDASLMNNMAGGIVFTNDGVYFKDIFAKPRYFKYADIKSMTVSGGNLELELINCDEEKYLHNSPFDKNALKYVLGALRVIDNEFGRTSFKSSGTIKKIDIPKEMMDKCNVIIHGASVACGGVGTGLAQIPASDNAVIVPIQVGMIIGLGAVFELNITESAAKSIIASAGATIAGRTVSQFLVGWIPGIGNAINTATAAGITEAIGWLTVSNFYERWIEDKNKGRVEGMKDGYTEASGEYERKIRRQADEFLNQMKDVKNEHDEYEKLLNEYETYIKELESRCAATDLIEEMKTIYSNLQGLESD